MPAKVRYLIAQDPRTKFMVLVTNNLKQVPAPVVAAADLVFEGLRLVKSNREMDVNARLLPLE